jgi:hypothetical protein
VSHKWRPATGTATRECCASDTFANISERNTVAPGNRRGRKKKGNSMITFEFNTQPGARPLYVQLYGAIKRAIERGEIAGGQKLPSKRALAANAGVSVITVEGAYNQLIAEGYITSAQRKGYFAANWDNKAVG